MLAIKLTYVHRSQSHSVFELSADSVVSGQQTWVKPENRLGGGRDGPPDSKIQIRQNPANGLKRIQRAWGAEQDPDFLMHKAIRNFRCAHISVNFWCAGISMV